MATERANLAFTGIPTFGRAPIATDLSALQADVAVLGVPFDEGVSFRPGTRYGPRAIRDLSCRFSFFSPESRRGYYDLERKERLLTGLRVVDAGDVDILYMDPERNFRLMTEGVRQIVASRAMPLCLGGDHSISFPLVRGLEAVGPIGVVQLDAHLDYRDQFHGVRLGHGSPMRRIGELPFVRAMASLGIRGLRHNEEDVNAALAKGHVIVTARELHRTGVEAALDRLPAMERCYVSIDIDGLDPSLAPGTGTPDPGGFTYWQYVDILRGLARRSRIVGFDLVEVNPMLDPTGVTPLIAAQLCMEFLGAIFGK
jgi:agmatinase